MGSHPVRLHLYDLTRGMAGALSPMLLGRRIDGIWHSGARRAPTPPLLLHSRSAARQPPPPPSARPRCSCMGPPARGRARRLRPAAPGAAPRGARPSAALSTPSPSQPPPPHVPSRARPAHPPHYPPGLVVHGREWFFGYGISSAPAGATPFGAPDRVVNLGATEVPGDMVEELVADLAPRFRPEDYNVRGRVGAGFGRGGAGVKARP
jgi:hypothetical protein